MLGKAIIRRSSILSFLTKRPSSPAMPPKALALLYSHEHGALRPASMSYCYMLKKEGYDAEIVDLALPDGLRNLDIKLASGEVNFCFGMQGVGSCLMTNKDVNLWTARRIPFVGIHYDSPCYNPFNHFNESRFVANLYNYESFLDIKQRYLPSEQVSACLPYTFPQQLPVSPLPFEKRTIRLLYLKSGYPVEEFAAYIDSLPHAIRGGVWQQLERAGKDPNLQLADLAAEVFESAGLDRHAMQRQFWGVVQTMDFYLRRKRAIDFVDWLKFQPGAVIIGNGWDFIDKTGAAAEFHPSLDIAQTAPLYHQAQFVCNTNPYGRDIIHERAVLGLMFGSCVLTDTHAWWDERFAGVPALTRFRRDLPLDAQLQPAIADMAAAAARAKTGPAAAGVFVDPGMVKHLLGCVARVHELTK